LIFAEAEFNGFFWLEEEFYFSSPSSQNGEVFNLFWNVLWSIEVT